MVNFNRIRDKLLQSIESRSRLIYVAAQGCSSLEIENLVSSSYDIGRLGYEFTDYPEEASMMIVSGWINDAFAEKLKDIHNKLILDKAVLAVGSTAISGSPFSKSGQVRKVSDVLPVSAYVAGCPPRPEALIQALQHIERQTSKALVSQDKWIYEVMKTNG